MIVSVLGDLLSAASALNPEGGVIDPDDRLFTWPEIDDLALRLATSLVKSGVSRGDRVAILHPKSVWSFIAVHAVLRCGAIMVPLDPLGPKESVQKVLEFCAPAAVIGAATTLAAKARDYLEDQAPTVFASGDESEIARLPNADTCVGLAVALRGQATPLPTVDPLDQAYIIFTSGSTGEPKGIAHTHRSALAYVVNAAAIHGLKAIDRLAGTSPLHFDMSTLELYVVPYVGATAVTITEGELRFPASMSQRLQDTAVSVLYAVPYQLRQLSLRGDIANRELHALRQISFGGEPFAPGVLSEIAETLPPAELLNVYGPAEVNGIVSQSFPPRPESLDSVPIGSPWPGVQLRIVDDEQSPVIDGEPGELLAACPSQMVGYWGRADLDEQCFVTIGNNRWYRTGDIVSTDSTGRLHFHGRADTRVKVRGVRLELETIETVLNDMPGVDSSVVGVAEADDGIQVVVAWLLPTGVAPGPDDVVARSETSALSEVSVQRWCRDKLPANAIPTDIRIVSRFEPSRTGKIDRRALRASLHES